LRLCDELIYFCIFCILLSTLRLLGLHGDGGGGVGVVAAGVAGLALEGVGLASGSGERTSVVRTRGPGTVDTSGTTAEVDLELVSFFQLGDSCQFQIEGVHDHPGHDVEDVEDDPDEEHDDVIGKDHIIDNEGIDPGNNPPWSKDAHRPQPASKLGLLLQSESIEGVATADEDRDAADESEEGGHEQQVPHMMVTNVNKIKREQIVTIVNCSRSCLL